MAFTIIFKTRQIKTNTPNHHLPNRSFNVGIYNPTKTPIKIHHTHSQISFLICIFLSFLLLCYCTSNAFKCHCHFRFKNTNINILSLKNSFIWFKTFIIYKQLHIITLLNVNTFGSSVHPTIL